MKAPGLVLFALASVASADEVRLKNGDRLTGNVVTLAGGQLTFASVLAGRVTLKMADVESLTTDAEVRLASATLVLQGRLILVEGKPALRQASGSVHPFEWADVEGLNLEPPRYRWEGNLASGLNVTQSARDSQVLSVSAEFGRKTPRERKLLSANYAYGRQTPQGGGAFQTTQDNWKLGAQYDHLLRQGFFLYANSRLEGDRVNDLRLRTILGSGGGYTWVEKPQVGFSTELGLSSVMERFGGGAAHRDHVTAQVSTKLRRTFGRGLELRNSVDYLPSLNDLRDYLLSTQLTLRSTLGNGLFTDAKVVYDYDSTPAPNAKRETVRYIFGVGFRF
ncbi:MAG: DUF481 domain-containing protein [Fimbriimonadaceae bacterium]|nr:DUF481 domain-containing protein [Fimbriimonadaceae bacterium]